MSANKLYRVALGPIVAEVQRKVDGLFDDDRDVLYHVEITLTIAEARRIAIAHAIASGKPMPRIEPIAKRLARERRRSIENL